MPTRMKEPWELCGGAIASIPISLHGETRSRGSINILCVDQQAFAEPRDLCGRDRLYPNILAWRDEIPGFYES
ncbi:MAG: hypothetical protein AAGD25_21210 [Cyanobacteria bacterium P01_F01_bin.150]